MTPSFEKCEKNRTILAVKSTEKTKNIGKLDKYTEKNNGRIVIFKIFRNKLSFFCHLEPISVVIKSNQKSWFSHDHQKSRKYPNNLKNSLHAKDS